MDIYPRASKNSAIILTGCINLAFNLVVDFIESRKKPISHSEMMENFRKQLRFTDISSSQISKMAYELKRNHYIEIVDGDSVKLTNKAKIKLIDRALSDIKEDNKRRLVSFDIPETKRSQRNAFRRCIKRLGFVQIQKSLWVCNKNVGEFVEAATEEYQVEEYVAYFVVESSNIDQFLTELLNNKENNANPNLKVI